MSRCARARHRQARVPDALSRAAHTPMRTPVLGTGEPLQHSRILVQDAVPQSPGPLEGPLITTLQPVHGVSSSHTSTSFHTSHDTPLTLTCSRFSQVVVRIRQMPLTAQYDLMAVAVIFCMTPPSPQTGDVLSPLDLIELHTPAVLTHPQPGTNTRLPRTSTSPEDIRLTIAGEGAVASNAWKGGQGIGQRDGNVAGNRLCTCTD